MSRSAKLRAQDGNGNVRRALVMFDTSLWPALPGYKVNAIQLKLSGYPGGVSRASMHAFHPRCPRLRR
jgi:hypothetical protein